MTAPDHPDVSQPLPALVLASRSPRRRDLLNRAGLSHTAVTPPVDDGDLVCPAGVPPGHWVAALAYFKAAAVARSLILGFPPDPVIVLGADTVCVVGDKILGQPKDARHAREMIQVMASATHTVHTGIALLVFPARTRLIFTQSAVVRVGHIGAEELGDYLLSNLWQGKAGAYNLEERIEAGWPIEYEGDPTTVMGLPMDVLSPILFRALGQPSPPTQEVTR